MTRRALLLLLVLACTPAKAPDAPLQQSRPPATHHDYDILIRGGEIVDGSGAQRRRGDVAIKGDRIAAVGEVEGTAAQTIDATGLVVSPGFIDLLGNSEGPVLIDPKVESKVRQGITTEVTGEGHSPGPINDEMAAEMNRTRPPGFPLVEWRSLGDYMRFLESRGSAINFAFYVGATNAREIVLGDANRAPSALELERMKGIVDEAMQQGAVGLSSALIYSPGVYAGTEELIELAKVAGKHGGSYWTHLRSESDRIEEAIDEAIRIGREARVPVNIFHLKVSGRNGGERMRRIIAKIERAQKEGVDIAASMYPFTATSTDLTAVVPKDLLQGGYLAFRDRVRDATQRPAIVKAIESSPFYLRLGAENVLIRRIPSESLKRFERKRVNEIAKEMGVSPGEAIARLFAESDSSPTAIYFSLDEEGVQFVAKQPWVSAGSDSGAVVGTARQAGAHPRAYGTIARLLGPYVRDEKLYTLEEIVRRVTSLAASRAGFADRGRIQSGFAADIVVFDPAKIRDVSTYEDPHHFAEGVHHVIVNGVQVLAPGGMTGKLPGKVLRH